MMRRGRLVGLCLWSQWLGADPQGDKPTWKVLALYASELNAVRVTHGLLPLEA